MGVRPGGNWGGQLAIPEIMSQSVKGVASQSTRITAQVSDFQLSSVSSSQWIRLPLYLLSMD